MKKYGKDIYQKFNKKSTEELLKIWKEKDLTEYTEEVFYTIEDILIERKIITKNPSPRDNFSIGKLRYSQELYNELDKKETDELLSIWGNSAEGEYTEEALNAIKDILIERKAISEVEDVGKPIESEKNYEKVIIHNVDMSIVDLMIFQFKLVIANIPIGLLWFLIFYYVISKCR